MRTFSCFFLIIILVLPIMAVAQYLVIKPVDITIQREDVILQGKFYPTGEDSISPSLILLHGFPGNETDVLGLGSKISQADINVLTFNYGGTHQSGGEWNFENTQQDIWAAYNFLHQPDNVVQYNIDTSRIYLGGWSFGGGMALTYATRHPEITSVFSIAGTDHGEFMREYFRNRKFATVINQMFDELKAPDGPVRFAPGATPQEATPEIFAILDSTLDLRKCAPSLANKDILLMGGWDDQNVTIDQHILPLYRALQEAQADRIKIVAFQDDHSFRKSRNELAETIIGWLKTIPDREK
jgi:dipeptidyl aminopeptidase/acylaminoacyl peptidase